MTTSQPSDYLAQADDAMQQMRQPAERSAQAQAFAIMGILHQLTRAVDMLAAGFEEERQWRQDLAAKGTNSGTTGPTTGTNYDPVEGD